MKTISLIIVALFFACHSFAQNSMTVANDVGRIILCPSLPDNTDIPANAQKIILNKLNMMVSKNGLGGSFLTDRFVITANVSVLSEEVAPTIPPMIALELEPTLYIGDKVTGALYASYTYPAIRTAGETRDKAYISGLKKLSPSAEGIGIFIRQGKDRIIEWYDSQIDFILSQAESLKMQQKYEESISLLMSVPIVCKEAYSKAMILAAEVAQAKIDRDNAMILGKG